MLKDKIKAALKKFGLDEELYEKIKAEKEEDIDKAILDYVKNSEADKRATQAVQTREAKLKEEFEKKQKELLEKIEALEKAKEPDPEPGKNKETKPVDVAEIIKKAMTPFAEKLEKLEQANAIRSRESILKSELETAKLDPDWAKHITATDEDGIKTQVGEVKARIEAIQQAKLDEILKDGAPSGSQKAVGDSIIEEVAEEMNNGSPTSSPVGILDERT